MKSIKQLIVAVLLFSIQHSFAQVGIGNTNPQATLDVEASSTTSPADNDGILIPRMSNFPSAPGATRDGMLIFYTGTGMSGKGFYYWDSGLSTWNLVGSAKEIDDLTDGKSDGGSIFFGLDSGTNDDGGNNNIGLGRFTLADNTSGTSNLAVGYLALHQNTEGYSNIAIGVRAMRYGNIGNGNIAIGFSSLNRYAAGNSGNNNIAIGTTSLLNNSTGDSNVALGYRSLYSNSTGSSNVAIGYSSGSNSSGSNKLYIENSSANADNALIYGEFDNDILRTNSEFQIGNPTGNGYAFPTTDGTVNQILATDGSGQVDFIDASTVFTDTQNTLVQAYDQGGAGAGRIITADNGAVEIIANNSNDSGLIVFNNGNNPTAATFTARSITLPNEPIAISATASGIHGNVIAIEASIIGESSTAPYVGTTITNYGVKSAVTDSNPGGTLITNYGLFSYAIGGHVNWAGYFGDPNEPAQLNGNVYIKDNLYVDRGIVYRPNGAATSVGNILQYTDTNGTLDAVDPSTIFINTDNQNISSSGLAGTDLTIGIQGGTSEVVDLSSLIDHDWYQVTTTDHPTDISQSIFTNGKVGIGENNPDGFLEVTANNSATAPNLKLVDIGSTGARINFTNTGTTNGNTWTLYGDPNNTDANSVFNIYHPNKGNILRIHGDGETGINGVPDTDFHVYHNDAAALAGLKLENQGANNNWWRMFTSNATGNLFIYSTVGGVTPRGNFNDVTGVYSVTSDRRLKKDFKSLPFSWQNFMNLETYSYLYKVQKNDKRSLGLIAQDVKLIYPELVNYNEEEDVYHMNYSGFGVVAIKAVQELKGEVDSLKKENQKLKAQLSKCESLEARLSALENNTLKPSTNDVLEANNKE